LKTTIINAADKLQHSFIAVVIQLIIFALTGNILAGSLAGVFFFIGREHAQAEYRNIEKNYDRRRRNMPWYGGVEFRAWDVKSLLDWILPIVAVSIVEFLLKITNVV
jgi:hypothetical protein